jgi:flap endonuclease-1
MGTCMKPTKTNQTMGIKNLHKFLKKHTTDSYRSTHLSELRGKRIAIDTNIYLYKFKGCARENWRTMFTLFILKFRKYNIDCVCVYDTKAPVEKNARKEERRQRKRNAEQRIIELETAIKEYDETGTANELLHEVSQKTAFHSLLQVNTPPVSKEAVYKEITNLENQIINVSRDDVDASKLILSELGVPYLDSPNEAETLCSYLCCHQQVDAVLSDDTDVLVYGTPLFLTKLNMRSDTCIELNFADILGQLQLTKSQFVDLCIMSGTDYNDNIPNIGNEKAYKLVQKHTNIEGIHEEKQLDVGILNYSVVRTLFSVPETIEAYDLTNTVPEVDRLVEFCSCCNIQITEAYLREALGGARP